MTTADGLSPVGMTSLVPEPLPTTVRDPQMMRSSGVAGTDTREPGVFSRFTTGTAKVLGHAWVFVAALLILALWAVSGPLMGFSDTWQLIINTGTTIVTFLMVFIIQNTQNRDTAALHLKLDAVMRELQVSNLKLYDAENQGEEELERQRQRIEQEASRGASEAAEPGK
jgi:low affinity Fe/Cu permease